jgi:hypothetical protein
VEGPTLRVNRRSDPSDSDPSDPSNFLPAQPSQTTCEVAFIDGNHGWPSVFVDFCYLNMMMPEGALLFVEGVHVYACEQLLLLLQGQPEFELVSLVEKQATFRKTTKAKFLPDWRGEPFVLANTSGVIIG